MTRLQRLWRWFLLTPIVYLLLGQWFASRGWIDTDPAAPHPWDTAAWRAAIGGATVLMIASLAWVGWSRPRAVQAARHRPEAALQRWVRDFYLLAVLCDSLAFLGLIYFAVSGQANALLVWGAAAYAGHVIAYPRRRELAPIEWPHDGA